MSKIEGALSRNMKISEVSKRTGIPLTTLRDFNKRGVADGIGQPGPNGHWLYSETDLTAFALAVELRNSGEDWVPALKMADAIVRITEGRILMDAHYQGIDVLAFADGVWGYGHDEVSAIQTLASNAQGRPPCLVTKLIRISEALDAIPAALKDWIA